MPEPTDHRAEAEKWLAEYRGIMGNIPPAPRDMLLLAHIHALLALSEPKAPTAVVHVSGNPSKAELEALRAAIRQPPPLSPSEG